MENILEKYQMNLCDVSNSGDKKVYCRDCKWLLRGVDMGILSINCMFPKNITYTRDIWYAREKEYLKPPCKEYIKPPCELNANNDCEWFEKEKNPWWKFSLRG